MTLSDFTVACLFILFTLTCLLAGCAFADLMP